MAKFGDLLVQRLRALVDPARQEKAKDGELLARWAAQRDSQAFAALVWRHRGLVWRVSQSLLHLPEDAEDVFQATFLVLARKAASLQGRSSLAGWLYQTASRLARKMRTATARRLRHEHQVEQKTAADPLEEISVREGRAILTEELQRLSAVYREPIFLCLYEGASQDEAARQLGCSVSTLKRRLDRGRELLASRLTHRGLAPAGALTLTLCFPSAAPVLLVQQTITAAGLFAAEQALTGTAVVLAQGVLRAMLLQKLVVYLMVILALSGVTVASGLALVPAGNGSTAGHYAATQVPQGKDQPLPLPKDPPLLLDRFGEPLPPGAINRIGSPRFRHGGAVGSVAYTPDGKALASISGDGFVQLWDVATGKTLWRHKFESNLSWHALAVSADGKRLAVLRDYEYVLLAAGTGKTLTRHQWAKDDGNDAAYAVAIAPDLATLARGCQDATVRLYDAATGKEKLRMSCGDKGQDIPVTTKFSADGKMIYVVTRGKPGVLVFDTTNGKLVRTLGAEHHLWRSGLAVSPDSRFLAAIIRRDPMTPEGFTDRVIVWDVATGKQMYVVELDMAWTAAFSHDSSLLAIGTNSQDAIIVDTATGKVQRQMAFQRTWRSLAFAPDNKSLAAGDQHGCITLADVSTGKVLPPTPEPCGFLSDLHFLDGGRQLYTRADDGFYWLDVNTGQKLRYVPRDPGREWSFGDALSPDGKMATSLPYHFEAGVMVTEDLLLIDTATGKTIRKFTGPKSPYAMNLFSPSGSKLFAAGGPEPHVFMWDIATGKLLHELKSHTSFLDQIALSPDGRWLASWATVVTPQGRDFDIRLWDVETGKLLHRIKPLRDLATNVFFSADSRQLVSSGAGNNKGTSVAQLWDVASGTVIRTFDSNETHRVYAAMTSDGRMLVTTGADNSLRLWEVSTGVERRRISGHQSRVMSLDFSANGKLLAAASVDAPVFIWDVYGLEKTKVPLIKLTIADRERLWQHLADSDGAVGFKAVCELIARSGEAVVLLEEAFKKVPRANSRQIEQWIKDLNSDKFAVRKSATTELERFVTGNEDLLRTALAQATTLEVRQRLENALARPNPERLRRTRMLEALEQIGTPQARHFLQVLADQTEDPQLAREAAAGLKRLEQR